MNYIEIYNRIVKNAKNENRERINKDEINYTYFENHHIIPKCLGGTNDKENLVLLTAREHYICHKLLMYIHPNNRGIILSFIRMLYSKNFNIIKNSKDYQIAKEFLSNQMKGKKLSVQHKINIGKGLKGKLKGISKTLTAKAKMSESRKKFLLNNVNPLLGSKRPEQSKRQIGKNNPMYGKTIPESSKIVISQKMKEIMKGRCIGFKDIKCKCCGKITTSGNYARWHGKNCKFKNKDIIDV